MLIFVKVLIYNQRVVQVRSYAFLKYKILEHNHKKKYPNKTVDPNLESTPALGIEQGAMRSR